MARDERSADEANAIAQPAHYQMLLALIEEEIKTDPQSAAYLVGREHIRHRNSPAWYHDSSLTRRRAVLDGMTPSQLAAVFTDKFQFGNGSPIAPEMQTIEAVAKSVDSERDNRPRYAMKMLHQVLGQPFERYLRFDRLSALKALFTVLKTQIQYPSNLYMAMLSPSVSGKQASFQVHDHEPLAGHEANAHTVYMLGELCDELRFGIAAEPRAQIDRLRRELRPCVDRALNALNDFLKVRSRGDLTLLAEIYRHTTTALQERLAIAPSEIQNTLPHDLYYHLSVQLPWEHLEAGESELEPFHSAPGPLTPITAELKKFAKGIWPDRPVNAPLVPVDGLNTLIQTHCNAIRAMVAEAFGAPVSSNDITDAQQDASALLWRYALVNQVDSVAPSRAIAAICVVLYESKILPKRHPTKLEARWPGGGTKASVIDMLKAPPAQVPEAFVRLWFRRLSWFDHALVGQLDVLKATCNLEGAVRKAFLDSVRTRNLALVEQTLERFERYVLNQKMPMARVEINGEFADSGDLPAIARLLARAVSPDAPFGYQDVLDCMDRLRGPASRGCPEPIASEYRRIYPSGTSIQVLDPKGALTWAAERFGARPRDEWQGLVRETARLMVDLDPERTYMDKHDLINRFLAPRCREQIARSETFRDAARPIVGRDVVIHKTAHSCSTLWNAEVDWCVRLEFRCRARGSADLPEDGYVALTARYLFQKLGDGQLGMPRGWLNASGFVSRNSRSPDIVREGEI